MEPSLGYGASTNCRRFYRSSQFWPSLGQLRGTRGKHVHLCPADDEPEILETMPTRRRRRV
jgi:hypothetical protein